MLAMLKGIAQWQSLFVFGMAEVAENSPPFPPQASLPPCCVIKNGALILREKRCQNEFLRTFEGGMRMCLRKVRRMEVIRLLGDKANPYN